ncbi:MAG TPA: hypothetical protein VNL71_10270 [Chloroflexota bacterium]|nr:hypothetical protein [Chloroflexota bacterium]
MLYELEALTQAPPPRIGQVAPQELPMAQGSGLVALLPGRLGQETLGREPARSLQATRPREAQHDH